MVQERRAFKRKYLMFYSRVFNRQTGEMVGHLVDLTPEGAMLLSERPIATDAVFSLHMELPDDVSDHLHLKFEAKSLWCKRDVNPDFYAAGFQLLDMPQEDLQVIERLIEAYGFREH